MRVNRHGRVGSMFSAAILAGACLLSAEIAAPPRAQSFSIDWYKITGGQGTSTNAQFSVTGVVGQHDATETLSGGNYSLTGGFWSLMSAVQTPGAPTLTVTLSGPRTVVVSWPAPSDGFVLQQNATLSPATWVDVTNAVTSTPLVNQIDVSFSKGNAFYRLLHP